MSYYLVSMSLVRMIHENDTELLSLLCIVESIELG